MCSIGIAGPHRQTATENDMNFENNEHFASMRRTRGETLTFVVMSLVATLATTMLAIAPASAAGAKHAGASADTAHVAQVR
jgi:hypothetical protein